MEEAAEIPVAVIDDATGRVRIVNAQQLTAIAGDHIASDHINDHHLIANDHHLIGSDHHILHSAVTDSPQPGSSIIISEEGHHHLLTDPHHQSSIVISDEGTHHHTLADETHHLTVDVHQSHITSPVDRKTPLTAIVDCSDRIVDSVGINNSDRIVGNVSVIKSEDMMPSGSKQQLSIVSAGPKQQISIVPSGSQQQRSIVSGRSHQPLTIAPGGSKAQSCYTNRLVSNKLTSLLPSGSKPSSLFDRNNRRRITLKSTGMPLVGGVIQSEISNHSARSDSENVSVVTGGKRILITNSSDTTSFKPRINHPMKKKKKYCDFSGFTEAEFTPEIGSVIEASNISDSSNDSMDLANVVSINVHNASLESSSIDDETGHVISVVDAVECD